MKINLIERKPNVRCVFVYLCFYSIGSDHHQPISIACKFAVFRQFLSFCLIICRFLRASFLQNATWDQIFHGMSNGFQHIRIHRKGSFPCHSERKKMYHKNRIKSRFDLKIEPLSAHSAVHANQKHQKKKIRVSKPVYSISFLIRFFPLVYKLTYRASEPSDTQKTDKTTISILFILIAKPKKKKKHTYKRTHINQISWCFITHTKYVIQLYQV